MPAFATRPSATTIGELDIHMLHLQQIVAEIRAGMVTKTDMINLKSDIQADIAQKFVSTERFEALEKKVDAATISSSLMRWASIVTKVAGAVAAAGGLFGLLFTLVHYADKIKALL